MGRRTLLLITSILIAAVGTALIGLYVRGANDRAIGDNAVQKVLVATQPIAAGATLSTADYTLQDRRAADLPSGFLDARSTVAGRAIGPIYKGQILLSQMLTTSDTAVGSHGIAPTQRGITIELQDPERAAGLLEVGSLIDIYSIVNNRVFKDAPVLTSVKVIAIGPANITDAGADTADGTSSGTTGAETIPTTLVGLTLSSPDVVALENAQAKGKLFFAVLPGETK